MDGRRKVWERYFSAEMCSRYWAKQSSRHSRRRASLSITVLVLSILPVLGMGLGVVDTPWFLAGCGVIVAAIGWFASGRFNERAALSSMAHVVWGDLSSSYQRLWERSREGGNVADREIEEVEAQENMISALTRREFGEADRRLVVESEEECYKFFGVKPSAEKDSADSSLQEEHAS